MAGLFICGEEESLITRNNGRPLFKKPRSEGPLPIICSSRKAVHLAVNEQLPLDEDQSGDNESTHEEESGLVLRASHSGEESSSEGSDEGTNGEAENEDEDEDEDDQEEEEAENDDEDEDEDEEEAKNGNPSPVGTGSGGKSISVTLTDTDVLDCPICLEPLSSPVYQCLSGHIVCASCCIKMSKKCGICRGPIGDNRCRAMEKVLESIKISCQNMQYGCIKPIHYYLKSVHEKTCYYAPCSCPYLGCDYVGMSLFLYTHFATQHSNSSKQFDFDSVISISLDRDAKHVFLQKRNDLTLFILNRSIEPRGSVVNVVCVAPTSSSGYFSYDLTSKDGGCSVILKASAEFMPKWNAEPPARNFLVIPSHFSVFGELKVDLIIRRLI